MAVPGCQCPRCRRQVELVRLVLLAVATAAVLVGIALTMTGCGGSLLDRAVLAANGARELELGAGEVLRVRCTEAYRRATAAQVPDIDRTCIPARKAYGVLRSARLTAVAAITVARVRENNAELLLRAGQLGAASTDLARTLADLPGE